MWLNDLPNQFVQCRSIRHAWDGLEFRYQDVEELQDRGVYVPREYSQIIKREVQCVRCDTHRVEYFGRSQEVLRDFERFYVAYFYPDGYLWHATDENQERPMFRDVNRELFRRMAS